LKIRSSSLLLRWISLLFILFAAVVLVFQLVQYSLQRANYPPDMTIGGVAVGGLDPQSAAQRLLTVYASSVELNYQGSKIQLDPGLVSFELNIESMVAAADIQRTGAVFWNGFWNYIWNRPQESHSIPLVCTYSVDQLRSYLQFEISARYDIPPIPAHPISGSVDFAPGNPGQTLDIDSAMVLIDSALKSPSDRVVNLTTIRIDSGRPSIQTLEILLDQVIEQSTFDGLVDIYFQDLDSFEKIHFATMAGIEYPVTPVDIAFTASSTIKIPVMVSIFQHFGSEIPDQTIDDIRNMIALSDPISSDILMSTIDASRGPLIVTETMHSLGLNNTFISMYFAPGSIPLDLVNTEANSRFDITTNPDDFNQTTPSDIGLLLEDIYLCSQTGGGSLIAAFPGKITQQGCQMMIQYLTEDELGALIQAGVPEGTVVAHKHGYDNEIFHISDAAMVFTPGGNYILCIYAYHPSGFIWNIASPIFAEISRAIYNYINITSP
jgi:beta-lactamase class A